MSEGRIFSRFRPAPVAPDSGYAEVPPEGLCLNAFVIVRDRSDPSRVLLGQVDPSQAWQHLGALDARRLATVAGGWMLPSSQLLRFESPDAAARRIATEQLGMPTLPLEGPHVASEAYGRPGSATDQQHWDIHFWFDGVGVPADLHPPPAWSRLEFVDPRQVRPQIRRGHADVLALAGVAVE